MENMYKFIDWFHRLGGNAFVISPELLFSKFEIKPIEVSSSLKDRAKEIKDKYNHVFKHDEVLDNYPNINKLNFEKK